MKKILLTLIIFLTSLPVFSQYTTIFETSFEDWTPAQGWIVIDNDTVSKTVEKVAEAMVNSMSPTVHIETIDYMLGIGPFKGDVDVMFMTPPLTLQSNPYVQLYSFFNSFSSTMKVSAWVITDPSNTTQGGFTDSIQLLSNDGYNSINLAAYSNSTIRIGFKLIGNNNLTHSPSYPTPDMWIDDIRVFEKQSLAYIPDNTFRSHLKTKIPAAFVGDSLDYTSPIAIGLRKIVCPNSTIESLEGLQYFPNLRQLRVPFNQINYIPLDRLNCLDSFVVNNNMISYVPDMPRATHIEYAFNVVTNIPEYYNNRCSRFDAHHNLITDCFFPTNRFVRGSIKNNIKINVISTNYYYFEWDPISFPMSECPRSTGTISGIVYLDTDMSGTYEPENDYLMPNQRIAFNQAGDFLTRANGNYALRIDSGTVALEPIPLPPGMQCTNPFNGTVIANSEIEHDFRVIHLPSGDKGFQITIAADAFSDPNGLFRATVTIKNLGGTTGAVTGKFGLPDNIDYLSSTMGTLNGDTLEWLLTLDPFEQISNHIFLSGANHERNVNVTLSTSCTSPTDGDLSDNFASTQVFIRSGSTVPPGYPHDPNYKQVSTPIVDTNFQDYLYYTIHFENIGTASASYVSVRDQLSNDLDESTFEFLGSSHPCTASLGTDNLIVFTFQPIVLTATSLDPDHSTGSVYFRIKPAAPMQLGDTIRNKASIIFDTQPPIITNDELVTVDPLRDAEFTASSPSICADDTILFEDLSTADPLRWEWVFEGAEQSTSVQKYPEVIYHNPGTYDVTLITHWDDGRTDTIVKTDYVTIGFPVSIAPLTAVCADGSAIALSASPAGGSFAGNGVTGNSFDPAISGVGTHTIEYIVTGPNGCSDTASTSILVHASFNATEAIVICEGDAYNWRGTDYSVAGSYSEELTSVNGCDSVYSLLLTVNAPYSSNEPFTICNGETLNWRGNLFSAAGTYDLILTDQYGCDSSFHLILEVTAVDNGVTDNGITITATEASATYQWVDCLNGSTPIDGATNRSYTPETTGQYAVLVTSSNCTVLSNCVTISVLGLTEHEALTDLNIYPNPAKDQLTIETKTVGSARIYSVDGRFIEQLQITGKQTIDIGTYATGVYTIQFSAESTPECHVRFVKE